MKRLAIGMLVLAISALAQASAQSVQYGPIPFGPITATTTIAAPNYPGQVDTLGVTVTGLATAANWTVQIQTSPDDATWSNCGSAVTVGASATVTATCTPQGGKYVQLVITAGSGGGSLVGSLFGQNSKIGAIGGGSNSLPNATAAGMVPVSIGAGTGYAAGYAPGSNFYSYPQIDLFGDSITLGIGVAGPPYTGAYGPLMIADFGGNGVDYGVSGATSADESDVMLKTINPSWTHNPVVTSMIGTNDTNAYGANTVPFAQDVAGMMEWATVPRNAKVFFTDSECTSTGTWANVTTYGFPGGVEQSTTPASTYTCTIITTGPALYFGFMQDTGWTASSMSILIDGVAPGTNPTINGKNYYGNQETYKFTTVRYPLAPGTHTFEVTFNGTSGTTGTISPVWLGSSYPISTVSPPLIYWSDVPVQQNNANASLIAQYNSALQTEISQLVGDGLPIVHVQENAATSGSGGPNGLGWLNTTSDFNAATIQGGSCAASTAPGYHPNGCGHAHIRDAFEYYIQPAIIPVTTLQPTVTVSGSAQNQKTIDMVSTYQSGSGGPTHLTFYTGNSNGQYTGIYTSNQFGGNYGILFDPAFNSSGPLVSVPYFGLSYGAANFDQEQNGMVCEASAVNAVLCAGGSGTSSFNAAFNFTLYGQSTLTLGNLNPAATQTAVNCSTSGTVTLSEPEQGSSYKKVVAYFNACLGTFSYTFPTAFSHAPQLLSQSITTSVITSISTTAASGTGSTTTGFADLDGY